MAWDRAGAFGWAHQDDGTQGLQLIARKPGEAANDLRAQAVREQSATERHAAVLSLQGRIVHDIGTHDITSPRELSCRLLKSSRLVFHRKYFETPQRKPSGNMENLLLHFRGDESTKRLKKISRSTMGSQWPGQDLSAIVCRLSPRPAVATYKSV